MNLDETCVSFAPEMRSGLIVVRSAHLARTLVRKQDTRTNLTYIAVICDDPDAQRLMPHVIIGNESKITLQNLHVLRSMGAANVHVWRNEKSSWNNSSLMQRILRVISDALSHRADIQPVLILDVAPCRITNAVMLKAKALGIWLVYVPAQITHLVQPLDTHAFASFKAWLRRQYADLRGRSPQGIVPRLLWLKVLQSAKAKFFDAKEWGASFADTGARLPVEGITRALQKYVPCSAVRKALAAEPDVGTLSPFWPKNRRMVYAQAALFASEVPASRVSHAPAPAAKRPLPAPAMSIALSSRSNKRACRQFPSRSTL